jgi:hypothetical protein
MSTGTHWRPARRSKPIIPREGDLAIVATDVAETKRGYVRSVWRGRRVYIEAGDSSWGVGLNVNQLERIGDREWKEKAL